MNELISSFGRRRIPSPRHPLHLFSGKFHRRDSISSFGRQRIQSPRRHLFIHLAGISIATPQSFQRDWRFPSPRRNQFRRPANPIAAPQSILQAANPIATPPYFKWASKSHCRVAIISAGWQIPSPLSNHFRRLANFIAVPQSFQHVANPISAPPSFQRASDSHCRATIFSAGRRTQSYQGASAFHHQITLNV
jgi:hypothetical protein